MWSVKSDTGYCHDLSRGKMVCYPKVRLFIEDGDVKLEFTGDETRILTLLPGKHDGW